MKVLKLKDNVTYILLLPDGKNALCTIRGSHQIWKINLESEKMEVYAGKFDEGHKDGTSENAQFNCPHSLAFKSDGSVVVADEMNHVIRVISSCGKFVGTIAGLEAGYTRDEEGDLQGSYKDGDYNTAQFNNPIQAFVGPDDSIYVADGGNHCIRKITKGQVSTIAGQPGVGGYKDGVTSEALFHFPTGIAIDEEGNLYVVDENSLIRKIDMSTGIVSAIAGQEGVRERVDGDFNTATFYNPTGINIDGEGNLIIADKSSVRYVNLTSKTVHTITGHEESHLSEDDINSPKLKFCLSTSLDLSGNIIISDFHKPRLVLIPHTGGLSLNAERLYERLQPQPSLLEKDMKKMLVDATAYDSNIKIQVVDTIFECHKGILMARCEPFKSMFESNWMENEGGVIRIGGTTSLAFKSLLLYLYSGNLVDSVFEDVVIDLLELSSRYLLKELEKYCLWFIESNVCLSTGIPLLIWATDKGDMYIDLRAVLKRYVVTNYKAIEENEGSDTLELLLEGHSDLKDEIMSKVGEM